MKSYCRFYIQCFLLDAAIGLRWDCILASCIYLKKLYLLRITVYKCWAEFEDEAHARQGRAWSLRSIDTWMGVRKLLLILAQCRGSGGRDCRHALLCVRMLWRGIGWAAVCIRTRHCFFIYLFFFGFTRFEHNDHWVYFRFLNVDSNHQVIYCHDS